jgi:hypothetical protein
MEYSDLYRANRMGTTQSVDFSWSFYLQIELKKSTALAIAVSKHTEFTCLVKWQLLLDAVLSDNDSSGNKRSVFVCHFSGDVR